MTISKTDLMAVGFSPFAAGVLGPAIDADILTLSQAAQTIFTIESGVAAAGSTISDATATVGDIVYVKTAASNTGVKLRTAADAARIQIIVNRGLNAVKVYPPTAQGSISKRGAGTAVSLNSATAGIFAAITTEEYMGLTGITS